MFWVLPVNLNFAVLFQKQNKTKKHNKTQLTYVGFFWMLRSVWKIHSSLKKQKLLAVFPPPRSSCYWYVLFGFLFLSVHVHLDLCRSSTVCSFIILLCSYLSPVPQCPLIEIKARCQIRLSISSLVVLKWTALLGSAVDHLYIFFLSLSLGVYPWGDGPYKVVLKQLGS